MPLRSPFRGGLGRADRVCVYRVIPVLLLVLLPSVHLYYEMTWKLDRWAFAAAEDDLVHHALLAPQESDQESDGGGSSSREPEAAQILHVSGPPSYDPPGRPLTDDFFGLGVDARRLVREVHHCQWVERKKEAEGSGRTGSLVDVCRGGGDAQVACVAVTLVIEVFLFLAKAAYNLLTPDLVYTLEWRSERVNDLLFVEKEGHSNAAPPQVAALESLSEQSWNTTGSMRVGRFKLTPELLEVAGGSEVDDMTPVSLRRLVCGGGEASARQASWGQQAVETCTLPLSMPMVPGDGVKQDASSGHSSADALQVTLDADFKDRLRQLELREYASDEAEMGTTDDDDDDDDDDGDGDDQDDRDGGGGWLVAPAGTNPSLGDQEGAECNLAGSVRVRFLAEHAAMWTAVGSFEPPSSLGVITTARGKRSGRLRPGIMSPAEAFDGLLPFWRGVGAARATMAVLFAAVFRFLRQRHRRLHGGGWRAGGGSRTAAGDVLGHDLAIAACAFGIYLSGVWVCLYGYSDWQGLETSRSQVYLLGISGVLLVVLLAAPDSVRSTAARGVRRALSKPVELLRVNSGYYQVVDSLAAAERSSGSGGAGRPQLPAVFIPSVRNETLLKVLRPLVVTMVVSLLAVMLTGGARSRWSRRVHWGASRGGLVGCGLAIALVGGLLAARVAWATLMLKVRARRRTARERQEGGGGGEGGRGGGGGGAGGGSLFGLAPGSPSLQGPALVSCPICLEHRPAREARVMVPCGHTICASCLSDCPPHMRARCVTCRAVVADVVPIKGTEKAKIV